MGLRIVLVGLVAGLGLSIPSRDQLGVWRGSARSWMSAQLAEWDGQMPAGDTAFVVVPEPTPSADPVASQVAEVVASSPEPATEPSVATAGAATADRPAGVVTPTQPVELVEGVPAPAAADSVSAPALEISDAAFDAALSDVVAGFAADRDTAAIVALEAPKVETVASFEPEYVCDDAEPDIADVLNHEVDGLDLTRPLLTIRDSEPVDLIDFEENLYAGIAYDLNREADGLETPTPAPAPVSVPTADAPAENGKGRLTHAVRLTREAVYAWANLLHGPAVVTLDH